MDETIIDNRYYQTLGTSFAIVLVLFMIVVAVEVLEMARKRDTIENFDTRHPDGEKSQIFSKLTA